MATNCVPGNKNQYSDSEYDALSQGCWAESNDRSLIFVKDIQNDYVIYSIYNTSRVPVIEFSDKMELSEFKEFYSFGSERNKEVSDNKWIWHDKTPFPWDRVLSNSQIINVPEVISQANRVADVLRLTGKNVEYSSITKQNLNKIVKKFKKILKDW